jgi:hypothetical protein
LARPWARMKPLGSCRTTERTNRTQEQEFRIAVIKRNLKIKVIYSSETSVDFQQTTRRYIPEDGTLYNHRCENLTSYTESNTLLMMTSRSTSLPNSDASSKMFQTATGWKAGVRYSVGARDVLLFTASRPVLGPTQPPIQWVPGNGRRGVKLTTNLHLTPRLRMVELYLHTSSWCGA